MSYKSKYWTVGSDNDDNDKIPVLHFTISDIVPSHRLKETQEAIAKLIGIPRELIYNRPTAFEVFEQYRKSHDELMEKMWKQVKENAGIQEDGKNVE